MLKAVKGNQAPVGECGCPFKNSNSPPRRLG